MRRAILLVVLLPLVTVAHGQEDLVTLWLGKLTGRAFRIGHLGDFNDLMLSGTLCGVEMGLAIAKIPSSQGGVAAALDYLATTS